MDTIFKTFATEIEVDEPTRRATFTISTGAVDRDNDTIDPKGWQLDSYRKNAVVLFAHDYHALPVAKTIEIHSTDTALVATAEFPPKGTYPFADTVYEMVKGGFLSATSVGFRGIEHSQNDARKGYDYKKQELMEYSIVPIPSNPEALVSQRGMDSAKVKEWREQIIEWAKVEHLSGTHITLQGYAVKTGRTLKHTPEQFDAFEKDYLIESEDGSKTLSDARIGKLCAIHGIKEPPESQDHTQADDMRKVHTAAMDAYANAHHADTVMTSMATMEANIPTRSMTDREKRSMKAAHAAVQRAKDHALAAAELCVSIGGKSLADLADVTVKQAAEQKAKEAIDKLVDDNAFFELTDDDDNMLEFEDKDMLKIVGDLIAKEVGGHVRATLNAAIGRLD